MTPTLSEVVSVDEAVALYPDEWIFMQVTSHDGYHAPSSGVILAHHPKRHIIQRSIMKTIAKRKGDEVYYLFEGYPRNLSFSDCLRNLNEGKEKEIDRIERLMLREDAG